MKELEAVRNRLVVAAAAAAAVACMGRELARVDPVTESYVVEDLEAQGLEGVDILVVVDNSLSMKAEQEMLKTAFPSLLRSILTGTNLEGERLHAPVRDLHIGVVSTDMGVGGYADVPSCKERPELGDDGVLQATPRLEGCDAASTTYLQYRIGDAAAPSEEQVDALAEDFGCISVLGTKGCGFEQQLESARKALLVHGQAGGPNAGFLREKSILAVLFVTDEEDCSSADATMFDMSRFSYDPDLRCFSEKGKLHEIRRYVDDFRALRPDPDDLVLGFIVGVPPGQPACNGRGDELGGCSAVPEMAERVRADQEQLEYACTYPSECVPGPEGTCTSEAFPALRFVETARAFGENAVVQSICTDSFLPAVEALTERIRNAINAHSFNRKLRVEKDPLDPCRCVATCTIVEELAGSGACPAGKPPRDADGDTVPDVRVDGATGQTRTLCEIPQAGAVINGGADCTMACDDPAATYQKDPSRQGWWYDPTQDTDGDGERDPTISFAGVEPAAGSEVLIQCSSVVCPEMRQCGPAGALDATCCDAAEYCYRPDGSGEGAGVCLVRRDICKGYGRDVWCEGAGPLGQDPLIGGLCCLDPDMDGVLDRVPQHTDGDGVGDLPGDPAFACVAGSCVSR